MEPVAATAAAAAPLKFHDMQRHQTHQLLPPLRPRLRGRLDSRRQGEVRTKRVPIGRIGRCQLQTLFVFVLFTSQFKYKVQMLCLGFEPGATQLLRPAELGRVVPLEEGDGCHSGRLIDSQQRDHRIESTNLILGTIIL